jgi:hypothetical protein
MSAAVGSSRGPPTNSTSRASSILLEGLRRHAPECRTLVVSSNEVYGLVRPCELPIHESTPFRPNNPYGVSKVTQDMMALQYAQSHHLPVIRARSFNHLGPTQSDDFAASAFARQDCRDRGRAAAAGGAGRQPCPPSGTSAMSAMLCAPTGCWRVTASRARCTTSAAAALSLFDSSAGYVDRDRGRGCTGGTRSETAASQRCTGRLQRQPAPGGRHRLAT